MVRFFGRFLLGYRALETPFLIKYLNYYYQYKEVFVHSLDSPVTFGSLGKVVFYGIFIGKTYNQPEIGPC
jgi:hypothetical protein